MNNTENNDGFLTRTNLLQEAHRRVLYGRNTRKSRKIIKKKY